jgi:hypothetical protein
MESENLSRFLLIAFSSREPGSTSLENALDGKLANDNNCIEARDKIPASRLYFRMGSWGPGGSRGHRSGMKSNLHCGRPAIVARPQAVKNE